MKIVEITPLTGEIVEFEGLEWGTHRRSSGGTWEVLMGESWEPCYSSEDKLEAIYRAYKSSLNG